MIIDVIVNSRQQGRVNIWKSIGFVEKKLAVSIKRPLPGFNFVLVNSP
jgi:hypothetical protein